jgi:hypothetical protein
MVVRVGGLDGLNTVYTSEGDLITLPDERILGADKGWELEVATPWRRFLPTVIFPAYRGDVSSRLYVTTDRIVFIREIDPFRETKGDMTPYGFPGAVAKKVHLKEAKAAGARAFCEFWPKRLSIARLREFDRPQSWVDLRLLGPEAKQYAVTLWSGKGSDPKMQALVLSRFARKQDTG